MFHLLFSIIFILKSTTFCFNISQSQQNALPALNFGLRSDFSQNVIQRINVCENPSKYGFIQRSGTNNYYSIADIMLRWTEGENYCQNFGAHLPVPKNMDDVNFLRWFLGPRVMKPVISLNSVLTNNGGYWLGGYRSAETGNFKWVDNSPFLFTNWLPGEPNNVGGMQPYLHDSYSIPGLKYVGWNDWEWYAHLWIICELKCQY